MGIAPLIIVLLFMCKYFIIRDSISEMPIEKTTEDAARMARNAKDKIEEVHFYYYAIDFLYS